MGVYLDIVPTTNTIDLTATFILNGEPKAQLRTGRAATLDLIFDQIGIGNTEPLSIYLQQTPGNITISPGHIAYLERTGDRKIALRYAVPGEAEQSVDYVLS
jgi:hypothetical protein